jgi:hypothetical protein
MFLEKEVKLRDCIGKEWLDVHTAVARYILFGKAFKAQHLAAGYFARHGSASIPRPSGLPCQWPCGYHRANNCRRIPRAQAVKDTERNDFIISRGLTKVMALNAKAGCEDFRKALALGDESAADLIKEFCK